MRSGSGDRINAALRLLEAGGRRAAVGGAPPRWWERPPVLIGAVRRCACCWRSRAWSTTGKLSARAQRSRSLEQQLAAQPLDPARVHALDHC